MRDRKGPIGRATGIAEGVATVVRRRAHEREPHAVLYDTTGLSRLVSPEAEGFDALIDTAEALVELDAERRDSEADPLERAAADSEHPGGHTHPGAGRHTGGPTHPGAGRETAAGDEDDAGERPASKRRRNS